MKVLSFQSHLHVMPISCRATVCLPAEGRHCVPCYADVVPTVAVYRELHYVGGTHSLMLPAWAAVANLICEQLCKWTGIKRGGCSTPVAALHNMTCFNPSKKKKQQQNRFHWNEGLSKSSLCMSSSMSFMHTCSSAHPASLYGADTLYSRYQLLLLTTELNCYIAQHLHHQPPTRLRTVRLLHWVIRSCVHRLCGSIDCMRRACSGQPPILHGHLLAFLPPGESLSDGVWW